MKKSFKLFVDSLDVLDELTDEQAGQLFKAIRAYEVEEVETLAGLMKAIFTPFKNNIDREKKNSGAGKYHWNWKGGITSESQAIRNGARYSEWRKTVFRRDFFTCQLCWKTGGKLEAHHIKKFSLYPELRTTVSNGITLCSSCHKKLHKGHIKL